MTISLKMYVCSKILHLILKLALLKQSGFPNGLMTSPFGSADALTHSSGNAFMDSEAKASVMLPQR